MPTPLNTQNEETDDTHLPQRNVAGAVLRATRLSAGLRPEQLAAAAGVNEQTTISWESGREPLDSVPVTQVGVLKDSAGSSRSTQRPHRRPRHLDLVRCRLQRHHRARRSPLPPGRPASQRTSVWRTAELGAHWARAHPIREIRRRAWRLGTCLGLYL